MSANPLHQQERRRDQVLGRALAMAPKKHEQCAPRETRVDSCELVTVWIVGEACHGIMLKLGEQAVVQTSTFQRHLLQPGDAQVLQRLRQKLDRAHAQNPLSG